MFKKYFAFKTFLFISKVNLMHHLSFHVADKNCGVLIKFYKTVKYVKYCGFCMNRTNKYSYKFLLNQFE